jgi:hypothetical protein
VPRFLLLPPLIIMTLACASTPAPNQTSVWGHVELVPHADLRGASSNGNPYGDRRLRSTELVDYSRPGFSVIYLDYFDKFNLDKLDDLDSHDSRDAATSAVAGEVKARDEFQLLIRGGEIKPRFEPGRFAMRIGSVIRLQNLDREPHFVSCPKASFLKEVAPGGEVRVEISKPGDYRFYLPEVPGAEGMVFVAPGPFAVASSSGRFQISDPMPGTWTLHAWHPRLPPASRKIVLVKGNSLQVDFEMGVGHTHESN